jgi:sulfopyruvate decarboxylase TPP-binding subunit
MIDAESIANVFRSCGFTHVVWIPDSHLGQWESALSASHHPQLIRASREGEAIAVAAGLHIGGKMPIVVMQCTGLFEAGDALRNAVHDLGLPLCLLVGVRSYQAYLARRTSDNCPKFTEPILTAWQLAFQWLRTGFCAEEIEQAFRQITESGLAGAVLMPE